MFLPSSKPSLSSLTSLPTLPNCLTDQDESPMFKKKVPKSYPELPNIFESGLHNSRKNTINPQCHYVDVSPLHDMQKASHTSLSPNMRGNDDEWASIGNQKSSPISLPSLGSPFYNKNNKGTFSSLARIVSPASVETKETYMKNILSAKLNEKRSIEYQLSNEFGRKPEFNRGFTSMNGNKLISFKRQKSPQNNLRNLQTFQDYKVSDYNERRLITYNRERFVQPGSPFSLQAIFSNPKPHFEQRSPNLDSMSYPDQKNHAEGFYFAPRFVNHHQNRLNM